MVDLEAFARFGTRRMPPEEAFSDDPVTGRCACGSWCYQNQPRCPDCQHRAWLADTVAKWQRQAPYRAYFVPLPCDIEDDPVPF